MIERVKSEVMNRIDGSGYGRTGLRIIGTRNSQQLSMVGEKKEGTRVKWLREGGVKKCY